jgi:hypothetical protein
MPTATPDELIAMELNAYYANPLGFVMVAYPWIAAVMRDQRPAYKVAVMFIDSAYGAPNVERLHVLGFANLVEVNFGAASPDRHQANMRAYMWNLAKEWAAWRDSRRRRETSRTLGSLGVHIRTSSQTGAAEQGKDAEARLGLT